MFYEESSGVSRLSREDENITEVFMKEGDLFNGVEQGGSVKHGNIKQVDSVTLGLGRYKHRLKLALEWRGLG